MALTPSTMLALGTQAPDFALPDPVSGQTISLSQISADAKATVVIFMCNHCPFVKHILDQLLVVTQKYLAQGVRFVAINSNDVENYPEDAPSKMRELAIQKQFSFPYLYDESQKVARAYHAACTPDFFVFDQDHRCVYRGCFDDTSPGKLENPVTGKSLTAALDALLAQQPITIAQLPSMGCNIKWKAN